MTHCCGSSVHNPSASQIYPADGLIPCGAVPLGSPCSTPQILLKNRSKVPVEITWGYVTHPPDLPPLGPLPPWTKKGEATLYKGETISLANLDPTVGVAQGPSEPCPPHCKYDRGRTVAMLMVAPEAGPTSIYVFGWKCGSGYYFMASTLGYRPEGAAITGGPVVGLAPSRVFPLELTGCDCFPGANLVLPVSILDYRGGTYGMATEDKVVSDWAALVEYEPSD